MSVSTTIQKVEQFAKSIKNGEHEKIRPGEPFTFSEASTVYDYVAQGDFIISIGEELAPEGYIHVDKKDIPKTKLVPGPVTLGNSHCLDSFEGVEMWVPEDFNQDSLSGPYMKFSQERTFTHPVHGNVTVPAGFSVHCWFQREYDQELQKERRARD